MKFKIVGKSLILTDYSHQITEGENSFDTVEITVPRYHDDCDLSALSFRFSETSEDGESSAVQVLCHTKCDEKYIYLKGTITSDFSEITGNVVFMLTGVNGENIVAKFQSAPYTVSDDKSLASMPNETAAEQLFNQAQLEVQKAIAAAERAEAASQTPAPAEIYPAADEQLGGILSGGDISVSGDGTVTVNSVNGKTLGKSVPADAVFTDTVYTLPKASAEVLGGVKIDGTTITASSDGTISAVNAGIYPAADDHLGGILSGGDISVGGDGTVTVNSVNGKTLGKSVPADAVFTDTVYTLPNASAEVLGGVKVDGTTITASSDGTISAVNAGIYPAADDHLGGILSGGDISVGSDGTVTVNSVNGKTLGKSVPADAVFTDTVYTLPKASAEVLGGVKVDGTTITASSDGTISAPGCENLKSDIKNTNMLAVQIAHPNNYLIYDDAGKPSVMVAIPKFYLDEVINGASHTVHPAFIINGAEQEVIYISKYLNVVENERAYSLPMKKPQTSVNFEQAWNYCKNKGDGWHLMTNAEWAAIALWCKKNGTMPKGNNNFGKDTSETALSPTAIAAYRQSDGKINSTLTGSGRESWYHNGTFSGISDLNGNVWEWSAGMRLNNGEIQIIENNEAAIQNNLMSSANAPWKAILSDGSLVASGTADTLKYSLKNGKCTVCKELTNQSSNAYGNSFKTLLADSGVEVPEIMKALALYPADTDGYGEDYFYTSSSGERFPIRGGNWNNGVNAGVFDIALNNVPSNSNAQIGFRCAYFEPQ